MRWTHGVVAAIAALTLAGSLPLHAEDAKATGFVVDHACVDATDKQIPATYLDKARHLKVLFGHQSIGTNVLGQGRWAGGGLTALAKADEKRYALTIQSRPKPEWFDASGGIGEFPIGRNGRPEAKAGDFEALVLQKGYDKHVDVAMMKLCFVDFLVTTVPDTVFSDYRDALLRVEKACPKVRVVWWTAPTMTPGKPGNAQRHAYNELVRDYCKKNDKVLFDLAAIESHAADGKPAGDETEKEALCEVYSSDGGHLNKEGADRVARAWWWLMARLAGWDGKPEKG